MRKVMIVDDTMFMRLSLKKILEKNNFEVVGEAENGYTAVQLYKELKPDVVTMDITMPGMTGIEALKKIREFDSRAKIVVVSALGQEQYVVEAVASGAAGFIVKPIKEEHMIKTLNNLCGE